MFEQLGQWVRPKLRRVPWKRWKRVRTRARTGEKRRRRRTGPPHRGQRIWPVAMRRMQRCAPSHPHAGAAAAWTREPACGASTPCASLLNRRMRNRMCGGGGGRGEQSPRPTRSSPHPLDTAPPRLRCCCISSDASPARGAEKGPAGSGGSLTTGRATQCQDREGNSSSLTLPRIGLMLHASSITTAKKWAKSLSAMYLRPFP